MITTMTFDHEILRGPEWPAFPSDDRFGNFAHYTGEIAGRELIDKHGVRNKEGFNEFVAELCRQEPPLSARESVYFAIGASQAYERVLDEKRGVHV